MLTVLLVLLEAGDSRGDPEAEGARKVDELDASADGTVDGDEDKLEHEVVGEPVDELDELVDEMDAMARCSTRHEPCAT